MNRSGECKRGSCEDGKGVAMQEQILGDYRVLRKIGSGALGDVLLGEHRFLKKQFVLKILPAEVGQGMGFIERFEEEAARLALFEHPHIVKIHNMTSAEGVYFLVTDCIIDAIGETTNLAQYMSGRKERLREEELLSLMRQIADALDYAHSKIGVAHQGLKLNNFLVGKAQEGIDIYISDYGLAKLISPGKMIARTFQEMATALNLLPQEGSGERYISTPIIGDKLSQLSHSFLQNYPFLAPEQKRCDQVGPAADVYAFGVLTYYLISGQFPEGIFPLPSSFAPEYVYDWDQVVTQCLNQNPSFRPKQLLPLMEKKKQSMMQPLPKTIETLTIEPLKQVNLRPPSPQQLEREEPHLKPWIQRNVEELAPPQTPPQPSFALAAATPALKENSVKESSKENSAKESSSDQEAYAQQLNAMLNRDPIVTQYHPEKKEMRILEPLQTEMSIVRGGQFTRGSNGGSRDEMPPHKVVLRHFALDIHPVTNEQFLLFLEFMGGEKDHHYNDLIRLKDSKLSRSGGKISIEAGYARHPVVGVTWYGAIAYAKWEETPPHRG